MKGTIFKFYRIPFILAISLAVVLISTNFRGTTLDIVLLLIGALLGMFFLDLDYFLNAYILEPEDNFSKLLRDYIKSKDISGAFNYIIYHADEVENKTLNSAVFQFAMMFFAIFIVRSDLSIFFKSLILSTQLNTIFRFFYFYFQGHGKDWFWILKNEPSKPFIFGFNFLVLIMLGLAIFLVK
jgi:hypothetical protein